MSTIQHLPYASIPFFSKTVVDYLANDEKLKNNFSFQPAIKNIEKIILEKQKTKTDRAALVSVLKKQYAAVITDAHVLHNINLLADENTFTVCTAHQPNIFGGPLYCVYKIISAINLCKQYKAVAPQYNFVPVFYIGSEDHDLDELNNINLFSKRLIWETNQTGSVGRMKAENFEPLIEEIKTLITNEPNATELLELLQQAYNPANSIASATRILFNHLFGSAGLVILNPDEAELKHQFISIIKKELQENFSFKTLTSSNKNWEINYPSQVSAREINLFYLIENKRERIVFENSFYKTISENNKWNEAEMLAEVETHPERFSPNVVLRPLYQEMILPNIAFVGGGSEVAYWLQNFPVFQAAEINFPMVYLRNSVMLIAKPTAKKIGQLNLSLENIFEDTEVLIKKIVQQNTSVNMEEEKTALEKINSSLLNKSLQIDAALKATAEASAIQINKAIEQLEKKWMQAEKRKQEDKLTQLQTVKQKLFPDNSLQERYENFIPYYAKHGKQWIADLMAVLNPSEFVFTVVTEQD